MRRYPIAVAGLIAAIVGVRLQVRYIEEPRLLRAHGETYRRYTASVGRIRTAQSPTTSHRLTAEFYRCLSR